MNAVANALRQRGHDAHVEHPGYIGVGNLAFGVANEHWGADDGFFDLGMEKFANNCTDVDAIVNEICRIIAKENPIAKERV